MWTLIRLGLLKAITEGDLAGGYPEAFELVEGGFLDLVEGGVLETN